MKKYWKLNRDSYNLLKKYGLPDREYFKIYTDIYICQEFEGNYDWMPLYHSNDGSDNHSNVPTSDTHDSVGYLKRYGYVYCGEIHSRREKLQKIQEL